jgi:uncharacterized paraquat-inducible protein A
MGGLPERVERCARCSTYIRPDQDWCLECGLAARTRLAPTPDWRIPLLAAVVAALLGAGALAYAFAKLTADDPPARTGTTAAPATAPAQGTGGTPATP